MQPINNDRAGLQTADAIIFDMDGTLWDGVDAYAQGFNDYFASCGKRRRLSKADIAGYMGWEEARFLAATLPELTADKRKEAYRTIIEHQYRRIEQDGGLLYDGVKEGLERLAEKYRLYIVSNCPEFTIHSFMKWAGISHVITDTMAHGQNYRHKYENIQYLTEKHDLQHPVYVGDTDADSKQSRLVPLPFIFVDYGFGQTEDYDLRFSSFAQLVSYFVEDNQ